MATKDVTTNPGGKTDFIAGQVYYLEKPAFLFKYDKKDARETPRLARLGFSGTPKDLEEFRSRCLQSPQVNGLLLAGERVRVSRFAEETSPTLGTFFKVFGTILSGECAGTEVQLNFLTKEGTLASEAFVDPEYLRLQKK